MKDESCMKDGSHTAIFHATAMTVSTVKIYSVLDCDHNFPSAKWYYIIYDCLIALKNNAESKRNDIVLSLIIDLKVFYELKWYFHTLYDIDLLRYIFISTETHEKFEQLF